MIAMVKKAVSAGLATLIAVLAFTGCSGGENASQEKASSNPPVSSQSVSSQVVSPPVSSQPPKKDPVTSTTANGTKYEIGNDTSDAVKGDYYHNTAEPYNSNYVTVCGDYALEIFGGASSKAYSDAVTKFSEKYPDAKVSCGIIPISSAFNAPEKYKNQYDLQKKSIDTMYGNMGSKVNTIDILGALTEHKGEYLYYRTDHHWTSLGAYYAYAAYMESIGMTPNALSSYETIKTTGYIGSLYALCAKPKPASLKTNPDDTIGRVPHVEYTLTYGSTLDPTTKGSALNPAALGYLRFINGDQPVTKIVTENKNGRQLAVFKESFGNAVVPYLIDHFEEIYVIDIREDTPSVATLMKTKGITDVLILNYVMGAAGGHVNSLANKLAS